MATSGRHRHVERAHPWWRPLALSAATGAALTTLFNPLPASATPQAPPIPGAPAVPDMGSRPQPLGTLTMPGRQPGTPAPMTATPGVAMTPLLQKIEKQRADIAARGDKLIRVDEDRKLANQQVITAAQKVSDAQTALIKAEQDATAAAAASMRDQAALPPGTLGSGLADLDALAQMQRGESETEEAASRHLAIVRAAQASALAEQATATTKSTDSTKQFDTLSADITKRQAALQKLEQQHAAEITAAEAAQGAADLALGQGYLDGAAQGRGADPRAIAALTYAVGQVGDPYVWSEEGPNQFDCSGLMFAAYRTSAAGGFPLARVSRDQYYQTRGKSVDRYSLVPGDLLFFSSSNSWNGIHHVAMYAGNGMMVEAPRTGLNVRMVPVRWSRLFQATRIYGSVEGATPVPDLPKPPTDPGTNPPPSSPPPSRPPPSKPPIKPSKPPVKPSKPPVKPSKPPIKPSKPPVSLPPSTPPSTPPSSSEPPLVSPPTTSLPSGGSAPGGEPSGESSGEQSPSDSTSAVQPSGALAETSGSTAAND